MFRPLRKPAEVSSGITFKGIYTVATQIVHVDLCFLPPTSQNQWVRGCAFRGTAENNLVRGEMPSPSDSRIESRLRLLHTLVRRPWQEKSQRFGGWFFFNPFFPGILSK